MTECIFPSTNLVDLVPYQFGYEKCSPSHSFGPAVRNHYLFHYVITGHGTLWAGEHDSNDKGRIIHAGQGFMIFPGQVCMYMADAVSPWEYTWLEFDGLRVREFLNLSGIRENHPVWRAGNEDTSRMVKDELLYMAQNGSENPYRLVGHAYLFIAALLNSASARADEKDDRYSMRDFYAKEAVAFVERNYRRGITVDDMADACRLNRSYFSRVFRETMGMKPKEYLISYRMTQAETLLRDINKSIAEVAELVGYNDQLSFSRSFRHIHGISPSEWRKRSMV